jgi:hypothetical protein
MLKKFVKWQKSRCVCCNFTKKLSCTIFDKNNDKKQNEQKSWELTVCIMHYCQSEILPWKPLHTAGLDTIFVQIYMDALPGVPGVSKNHNFFLKIKLLSFCARIAPKRNKLVKIEKKCQKYLVFLEYFEYSSVWGQY